MQLRHEIKQTCWGVSLWLIFALIILWQLPGTIAARNVALGALLCCLLGASSWTRGLHVRLTGANWLLVVLSSWILAVIFIWSPVRQTALSELRGQWLIPLACWVCGALAANISFNQMKQNVARLVEIIFWALFSQVALNDVLSIWFWIETGEIPFRQAPIFYLPEIAKSLWGQGSIAAGFLGTLPDKFSYVNNTFAALLIAESVQRVLIRRRFLNVSNVWLCVGALLILLCSYFLRMRNGNVGLIMLIVMTGLLLYLRLARSWTVSRKVMIPLSFLFVVTGLGYGAYKSDPRWERLGEAVPIALDTQTNRAWLYEMVPHPKVAGGDTVDISAYERFAWAKEGLLTIAKFPMGLGYNRNAFGVGIKERYGSEPRSLHSHSGLIDFALANGLPGLIIWIAFLLTVGLAGWRTVEDGQIALGFMTLFLVTGFFARSIVDSNMRDHVLQQFMFFAGLFYGKANNSVAKPRRI